jgi:hypothetical protein
MKLTDTQRQAIEHPGPIRVAEALIKLEALRELMNRADVQSIDVTPAPEGAPDESGVGSCY